MKINQMNSRSNSKSNLTKTEKSMELNLVNLNKMKLQQERMQKKMK